MKKNVKYIEFTCDGCGAVQAVPAEEALCHGWHGTVCHIHPSGGTGTSSWFACSQKCIHAALTNAAYPPE